MPADAPARTDDAALTVSLPAELLARYERFSCYNSPYPAHDRGRAVDLYPDDGTAPAPIPGEIVATRTVRCPDRAYAVDHDHLIVVDVDDDWAGCRGAGLLARILHVDPSVAAGDRIDPGDSLGETVRSGFFGRWVDDHLHLGFRPADANPFRASGSIPVRPAVEIAGAPWDGTGTVVETGKTYVRLDAPAHPDPGAWASLAADDGTPLDGGLDHYTGGGAYGGDSGDDAAPTGELSLLGAEIGSATARAQAADGTSGATVDGTSGAADGTPIATADIDDDGTPIADVDWSGIEIRANGERATGLSLFASRAEFGTKIVFHEGHEFAVGDEIRVELSPTTEPIQLG